MGSETLAVDKSVLDSYRAGPIVSECPPHRDLREKCLSLVRLCSKVPQVDLFFVELLDFCSKTNNNRVALELAICCH